ncbi:SDR family NAD(P)-dependent oxidoreductase [Massilia sp. 2TAF26]|uniref:SDR family NAD(P)-dependent oxidoreductase n=1 Tax=Massilia sp. 2TAF26 TaxID=3233012 RepID=UPI003F9C9C8F
MPDRAAEVVVITGANAGIGRAADAAAERAEQELGPIAIWVNNAMVALKRMRARDRGTILQVGSALAYRSIPLQSPYCGAKHAIKGFTQALHTEREHDRSKVHLVIVDMPGVNTPQFEWCKTTLHRHPRPTAACYRPEVAGRAIYWAAHSRRAEICLGYPTLGAVLAEKFMPHLLDRYRARTGIAGQQTDEAIPADRPDKLWKPVPRPFAAHASFDRGAWTVSPEFWAAKHRGWRWGAAALGVRLPGLSKRRKG